MFLKKNFFFGKILKKIYSPVLFFFFHSIHFCLTYNQSKGDVIIKFLNDLRECCKQVCQLPDKGKQSKTAALYGMAAQIPDKTIIEDVAHLYLDACYSMPTKA